MNGSTRWCRSIDDAALATLWSHLRAAGVERVRTHHVDASPHRGGVSLRIAWDGGACDLADVLDVAVDDLVRGPFDTAVARIDEAFAAAAPASGPCVAEPSPPPMLTDYDAAARPGSRHRVTVAWDEPGRTWTPAPPLRMPLHHASRFEWDNLAAFGALDGWRAQRLVFTITARDRTIAPDDRDGERVFFATYRARIDSVCGVE
jgi:hypothetical protein